MTRSRLLRTALSVALFGASLLSAASAAASDLLDPRAFLGYRLGERFTPPHRIADYAAHLAAQSPRVRLAEYGRTVEDRPLLLLAITSESNQKQLEDLRAAHLAAGPDDPTGPVIIWLGFGVHGNESSSPEAALALAWELAAESDTLNDTIVLIDPLSNPDGRSRYVEAFRSRRGLQPDPFPLAAEHLEPWPGGRTNHYLFDLNRDWAWLTQPETRARVGALRYWQPHVVVDLHEMSGNAEYFFPPVAEPVHPEIPGEILHWQQVFGRANAKAFDSRGWSYFVRKKYDLFYPGYGDSYPSLRGAVGMTYEVAGGGRAGIARSEPGSLSLTERLTRHLTTARTTIETATAVREELVRSLRSLPADAARENGSILWGADQAEAIALAELLREHGVRVEVLGRSQNLPTRRLGHPDTEKRPFAAGTFVVDLSQPLARLVHGLLDPDVDVPPDFLASQQRLRDARRDLEFYDLTAWALPLAWNLDVHRCREVPRSLAPLELPTGNLSGDGRLGALLPPRGLAVWRTVGALLEADFAVSRALVPLDLEGVRYPAGTLWVRFRAPEADAARLATLVENARVDAYRIGDSFPSTGSALGSGDVIPLRRPRIGLVGGPGVEATAFGSLWFFLDETMRLAPHRLDLDALDSSRLRELDVLLFPDGPDWNEILSTSRLERLERWIRDGGTAVVLGRAIEPWQTAELTSFRSWEPDDSTLSLDLSGAIVATRFSPEAPIGIGLPGPPPSLVRGETILLPSGDPRQDLLTVAPDESVLAGVVWPESRAALEGSLLLGSETLGDGRLIVFAGDPTFRGFWRGTMPLLLESILVLPAVDLGD